MTIRTRQIIRLLARGKSKAEIADIMGLTPELVRQDLHRTRELVGCENDCQLVLLLKETVTNVTQS